MRRIEPPHWGRPRPQQGSKGPKDSPSLIGKWNRPNRDGGGREEGKIAGLRASAPFSFSHSQKGWDGKGGRKWGIPPSSFYGCTLLRPFFLCESSTPGSAKEKGWAQAPLFPLQILLRHRQAAPPRQRLDKDGFCLPWLVDAFPSPLCTKPPNDILPSLLIIVGLPRKERRRESRLEARARGEKRGDERSRIVSSACTLFITREIAHRQWRRRPSVLKDACTRRAPRIFRVSSGIISFVA